MISARYREGRQHPPQTEGESITLVADLGGEIVGFIDARLERSPDPMHREMLYCHIVEIAVGIAHQSQGIGRRLLEAAEDWGREHGAELASLEYLAQTRVPATSISSAWAIARQRLRQSSDCSLPAAGTSLTFFTMQSRRTE